HLRLALFEDGPPAPFASRRRPIEGRVGRHRVLGGIPRGRLKKHPHHCPVAGDVRPSSSGFGHTGALPRTSSFRALTNPPQEKKIAASWRRGRSDRLLPSARGTGPASSRPSASWELRAAPTSPATPDSRYRR